MRDCPKNPDTSREGRSISCQFPYANCDCVEEGLVRATSRWQISEELGHTCRYDDAPEPWKHQKHLYFLELNTIHYSPMCIIIPSYRMQVLWRRENSHPRGGKIPPLLGRTFWFSSKSFEETFPLPSTQNVVAQVNSKLVCWFFFFWKYKYVHLEVSNFVWYKEEHFSAGCFLETGSKKAGKETMSMITEFVLYSVVVQNSELK